MGKLPLPRRTVHLAGFGGAGRRWGILGKMPMPRKVVYSSHYGGDINRD
jgi:hypothetical protein